MNRTTRQELRSPTPALGAPQKKRGPVCETPRTRVLHLAPSQKPCENIGCWQGAKTNKKYRGFVVVGTFTDDPIMSCRSLQVWHTIPEVVGLLGEAETTSWKPMRKRGEAYTFSTIEQSSCCCLKALTADRRTAVTHKPRARTDHASNTKAQCTARTMPQILRRSARVVVQANTRP
jgi:hypothetical protein